MSRETLKALMQLFALIARAGDLGDGKTIVESFLKSRLNNHFIPQYLSIFDNFLAIHQNTNKINDAAGYSNKSIKILKICLQLNGELTQGQKIIVLLRLIEFSNTNSPEINEDLLLTVSEAFNIDGSEYTNCMELVQGKTTDLLEQNILLINDIKQTSENKTKHLFVEGIEGQIRTLWIASVNLFAIIYTKNGTSELQLNGQAVNPGKIYILTIGASLRNWKMAPLYYSDIQAAFRKDETIPKIRFAVKNVAHRFKDNRLGLRAINFTETSGQLIGIMGGSGTGKTTLLNVINGEKKPSEGTVKINGINIHTEKDKLEGFIGMVSQDDLLLEDLTVYQNLYYNAKLCFGKKTEREIEELVLETLTDLGLVKIKDSKVGRSFDKVISGGQRKRLNIALELIREPAVLFLDEPTSGLSSRDSESIMDLLKELTLRGKLVFVVIHQPSSDIFKTFDKLILLDEGGYPIYYGNAVDSIVYFKTLAHQIDSSEIECETCGNVYPEQIFNIVEAKVVDEFGRPTQIRKTLPIEWHKHYKAIIEKKVTPENTITELPKKLYTKPSKLKQFKVFITRDILSKYSDKQYLLINILEAPVLALILSYAIRYNPYDLSGTNNYIFRNNDNIPIYLFMTIVFALFIGLMVSAEEIIKDRKIRKRESFLNLSKSSYLFSKILIMFAISAVQTLLFLLVGNYILELNGMIFEYWFVLFAVSCFANILGLNISSSFNSAISIYIVIPLLIIPQLLLSGVIVPFDKLNPNITSQNTVPIPGNLMASRWAYEALAVEQFKNNRFNKLFYHYDKGMSIASYKKNYWIPSLSKKLYNCEKNYLNPSQKEQVLDDLKLIQSEINWNKGEKDPGIKKLIFGAFDVNAEGKSIFQQTHLLLEVLKKKHNQEYNLYAKAKDLKINSLIRDSLSNEAFLELKRSYENKRLTQLVTNSTSINKIVKQENRYIQKVDPIYLDPLSSKWGNAHFFAPRKLFFNTFYDTFWFNTAVIWLMSILLIITLYFDAFRIFLNLLESSFLKFLKILRWSTK